MDLSNVWQVALAVITSLGGGAAIVFLLSDWLGKVWANRIMAKETAAHNSALEKLRNDLQKESARELEHIRHDLDIFKQKHLQGFSDKVATYRLVIENIAHILADLDIHIHGGLPPEEQAVRYDRFNRDRIKNYGYLALLAPQNVMDTNDALYDHLILVCQGKKSYEWVEVRKLAIKFLNEVRKDIGIDDSPIEYRGKL